MVVLLFLKLFLSSLVLSPRSEKHGDVVSTSTDSGSVIIDMVGRVKTSERTGGRDSGMSIHCIPGTNRVSFVFPFAWKREFCS